MLSYLELKKVVGSIGCDNGEIYMVRSAEIDSDSDSYVVTLLVFRDNDKPYLIPSVVNEEWIRNHISRYERMHEYIHGKPYEALVGKNIQITSVETNAVKSYKIENVDSDGEDFILIMSDVSGNLYQMPFSREEVYNEMLKNEV